MRKKGLMSIKDKKQRVAFAHKMLKCYEADVWRNDINFYLDGVGFIHKTNLQDKQWPEALFGKENQKALCKDVPVKVRKLVMVPTSWLL